MGRVWKAEDRVLDRVVAVKEVLLPQQVTEQERARTLARAKREALAAGRLQHPAVITIHDVIEHEGTPWIVMAYIDGRSLGAEIKAAGRMPWQRVAEIGEQIASGLAAAHASGIVHRDLKPDNVLLLGERVIVTDFGIARILDAATLSSKDSMPGTPQFMAPEQFREGTSGVPVDLWALGCTLYCAVEGKLPYNGATMGAVIAAVLERSPDPAAHAGPLGDLLSRLLDKDPGKRPDVKTAAAELARLAGPAPATATAPVRLPVPPPPAADVPPVPVPAAGRPAAPATAKRRGLLAGVAAVLAIALGTGVYLSAGGSPSPRPSASPAPTATAAAAAAAPVCATGTLRLYGSSAFQEIAQGAATAYMNACPHASITVNPGVSGGDSAFGVSTVQAAVKTGSSAAGSMIAMYDGPTSLARGLQTHPAGVLVYSVVAHSGLFPGSKISQSQLVSIFSGHGARNLVAVGRKDGSGSRQTFIRKILHVDPGPASSRACPAPSGRPSSLATCTAGDTTSVIAFVNGTPNAIGYAEVLGSLQGDPEVVPLWIDGVQPTKLNVLSGAYQYWTTENLYTSPRPDALARDFIASLPGYISRTQPGDFIDCSAAAKLAGSGCGAQP